MGHYHLWGGIYENEVLVVLASQGVLSFYGFGDFNFLINMNYSENRILHMVNSCKLICCS